MPHHMAHHAPFASFVIARFERPQHRSRLALFVAGGEDVNFALVAAREPIRFVVKMDRARQSVRDWLGVVGGDFQFDRTVAPLHFRLLEGQAQALGQHVAIVIVNAGGVQVHQAAAALEIVVELMELFVGPVVVPVIGDYQIGVAPLRFAWPAEGRVDGHGRQFGEQRFPVVLPGRVIVLADAVIFFPGQQHDFQRTQFGRSRATRRRVRCAGVENGFDLAPISRRRRCELRRFR